MIILKKNVLAGLLLFACFKTNLASTDNVDKMRTELNEIRADLNKVTEEINAFQQNLNCGPNFSECLDIVKDVIKRPTVLIVAGIVATSYLVQFISQKK